MITGAAVGLHSTVVVEYVIKASVKYLGRKPVLLQLGKDVFWGKLWWSEASSIFMFSVYL